MRRNGMGIAGHVRAGTAMGLVTVIVLALLTGTSGPARADGGWRQPLQPDGADHWWRVAQWGITPTDAGTSWWNRASITYFDDDNNIVGRDDWTELLDADGTRVLAPITVPRAGTMRMALAPDGRISLTDHRVDEDPDHEEPYYQATAYTPHGDVLWSSQAG